MSVHIIRHRHAPHFDAIEILTLAAGVLLVVALAFMF
jgi:hypothetical protein